MEIEQAAVSAKLADPALYTERAQEVPALKRRLQEIETETAVAFKRWEELAEIEAG